MISVDNHKKVYSNVLKIKLHYKDFRKKTNIMNIRNQERNAVFSAKIVYNYFQNSEDLIRSIKEYTRISKISSNEYTLNDLLK